MGDEEPFGTWLRRQVHRDDPVGDLARDFKQSRCRAYTEAGVRKSLNVHDACQGAWDALDRAVEEWTGT
jgi:hypothetical protein